MMFRRKRANGSGFTGRRTAAGRSLGLAIAAGALAACITAPSAQAADVGWCGTPQELSALMKAEGQRSLAYGNQRIPWNPNREVGGVIISADPQGNVGYVVRADNPMGTPATKACIALRLHDVRLYDVREGGIPEETLINSTAKAAERRCAELVRQDIIAEGSCGFHNDGLANAANVGAAVMLQGWRAAKQDDGGYASGTGLITVTLGPPGSGNDPDGKLAPENNRRGVIAFTALPEGASIIESVFIMGSYTAQALDMLEANENGERVSGLFEPR